MAERKKILLVDDHPLVREWLAHLIGQESDLMVCGAAEDVPEAKTLISEMEPDVVVLDLSLKSTSGIDLIKYVKAVHPDVAVLVLSSHDEQLYAERALRLGARGYLMKSANPTQIIPAIREVTMGGVYVSPALAQVFAKRVSFGKSTSALEPVETLSDRELEIFELLGRGLSTRQIAESLNISINTVQVYCGRARSKLRLKNALELTRKATFWVEERPAAKEAIA